MRRDPARDLEIAKTKKAGRSPEGLALKSPRLKTRNSQTQEAGRSLENEISF